MELHPFRTLGIGGTATTNGFVVSATPVPDMTQSPPAILPNSAVPFPNTLNGLQGPDSESPAGQQILQLVIVKLASDSASTLVITPQVSFPDAPASFGNMQSLTGGTLTFSITTANQIANCSSGTAFSGAAAGNAITVNIPIPVTGTIPANLNDGSALAASAQKRVYALRAAVTTATGGAVGSYTVLARILSS